LLAGAGLIGNSLAENKAVAPATPEAAAEWAKSLPAMARSQALHGVMAGWAESEPEAAYKWAKNLGEQDEWIAGNVIGVWSRKDPVSASRFALEMPEGPQKIRAMEQVGQAWGGKNRGEAMAWAEKIKADADRKAAVGGVVQSWAMQDPAAALQFAEGQSDAKLKEQYVGKVIYGWCFKDRPGAEKWVQELPEGDFKKSMKEAFDRAPVIRRRVMPIPAKGASKSSQPIILNFETPAELAKIYDQPLNQAREDALVRYLLDWWKKDKEKVTRWIPAKLKGYVLGKTAGRVARVWSQEDLAAAAEWVRQIPPFFRDYVAKMGAEWAADQPKEVAEVVLKWPDDSRRHVVLRGVCETWAKTDPKSVLAWTESVPTGATRKNARKGLVIGWSQVDSKACRAWAETLTDEADKKEAFHYLVHGLARSRPPEAIAYLQSIPGGMSDSNFVYCLAKEWATEDAPAAAAWAKSLPVGSSQEAALQAVIRQWVYSDAIRCANWAKELPDKTSRATAFNALMEMWVAQSPSKALNWAQALKKSDLKIEALGAMVGSWAQSEPKEAVDWVNQLPEGNEKTILLEKVVPPVCGMVQEEKVKVGQEAPLFTTKTVEGKELKLADYRGKFVLLDFWATWCGPCLGETPNLKAVFEKYGKRQDFALIGLSLDGDPAKPAAYAKENGCGWVDGFLGDWGKDEVTKLYGVRGIPSIWLIGPDGKVVASGLRGEGIMAAVSGALEAKP